MKNKDIVYIALFTALTVTLALFPPLNLGIINVPITAQSIGPMLAGSIIGSKRGFLAILLFLFFVSIGFPVLSGGRGGIHLFFGTHGGFLLSWPLNAFIIGFLFEKFWNKLNYINSFIFITFGGIFFSYILGIIWMSFVTKISIHKLTVSCLIFIPGDILKAILATSISMTIKKYYPIIKK